MLILGRSPFRLESDPGSSHEAVLGIKWGLKKPTYGHFDYSRVLIPWDKFFLIGGKLLLRGGAQPQLCSCDVKVAYELSCVQDLKPYVLPSVLLAFFKMEDAYLICHNNQTVG